MDTTVYEGYLWYSDQNKPRILNDEPFNTNSLNELVNPFVVEGQLWCKEKRESVSIKYIDGKYVTTKYVVPEEDLKKDKSYLFTKKKYIPHRLKGVKRIVFLQYWRKEKDIRCNNFETLAVDKFVFIGFEK